MKLSFVNALVGAAVLSSLVSCSSTGAHTPARPTSHAPDATMADSDPDNMTCADWAITPTVDRKFAAARFAKEFNDPKPVADLTPLTGIITTACSAYGAKETPKHIARVSIVAVYTS